MTFFHAIAIGVISLTAVLPAASAQYADRPNDNAEGYQVANDLMANDVTEEDQILPLVDLLGGDEFGRSVDISGNFAVVGVPAKFDTGGDIGAAYVFEFDGAAWLATERLDPDVLRDGDRYGWSVAVDGDTAVVGAYNRAIGTGTVYVWQESAGAWSLVDELTAPAADAIEWFGWSLDLDGDLMVVGAPLRDEAARDAGAVFVFERSETGWEHIETLYSPDPLSDLQLGYDVAIHRDTVVAGTGPSRDRAEVFKRLDGEWQLDGTLEAAGDGGFESQFGVAVGVDGQTVVVGAPRYDAEARADAGAVHVFDRGPVGWEETAILVSNHTEALNEMGRAVAIEGDVVVAGSRRFDLPIGNGFSLDEAGGAFVFQRDGGEWVETEILGASDAAIGDNLGTAVAIDDARAIVGAPKAEHDSSAFDLGKAYVFSLPQNQAVCTARAFSAEEDRVLGAYITYYGRAADLAGFRFWSQRLIEEGGNLDSIIQAFGESEEFERRFGDLDNAALVANIYQQVLGRDPDPDGFDFYLGQLEAGLITLQTIALNVYDGVMGEDVVVVDNRLLVAQHYLTRQEDLGDDAEPVTDVDLADIVASVGADIDDAHSACGALDALILPVF